MAGKQPLTLLSGAVIFCFLFSAACNNTNQTAISSIRLKLQQKASKISHDIIQLQVETKKTAIYTESLYNAKKIKSAYNNKHLYINTEKGILYKNFDDGKSAIYATGFNKIDSELIDIIQKTEALDSIFKIIIGKYYPLAAQIYFIERHSIIRIYPYCDLVSQFSAGSDVRTFGFYYLADEIHNKKKEVVFISNPYADPAGRGWMTSCIAPVYPDSKMQGILGIDITLHSIEEKYFTPDSLEILLVDTSGAVVYCNHNLSSLLSIPKLKDYKYVEVVEGDVYLPAKLNVRKSRNRSIGEAFDDILVKGKESSTCKINDINYVLIAEKISGISWYLVKIILSES